MKITQSFKALLVLMCGLPFFANHAANYESISLASFEKPIKGFSPYFEAFRVKVKTGTGVYDSGNNLIGVLPGSEIEIPSEEVKGYFQDRDLDEQIEFSDYKVRWYILESSNWNLLNSWDEIDIKNEIDSSYIDSSTHTLTLPIDAVGKRIGVVVVPETKTGLPRMGNPIYLWDLSYYFEQTGPSEPGFPSENPGEDQHPLPPVDPNDPNAGNPDNGGDPGMPGDPNPDFPGNGIVIAIPSIDKKNMVVTGDWNIGNRLLLTYEFMANVPGTAEVDFKNQSQICWAIHGNALENLMTDNCIAEDYEDRPEDDPAQVENSKLKDGTTTIYTSLSPLIMKNEMGEVLDIAILPVRYDVAVDAQVNGLPVELNIRDNDENGGAITPPPPPNLAPSVDASSITINGTQQAGRAKLRAFFNVTSEYPSDFEYVWNLIDENGNVVREWERGTVNDIDVPYDGSVTTAKITAENYLQQTDVGLYFELNIYPKDIFDNTGEMVTYSTLSEGLPPILDNKPIVKNLEIASNSNWGFPGQLNFSGNFEIQSVDTASNSEYVIALANGTPRFTGKATHKSGVLQFSPYTLVAGDIGQTLKISVTPINQLGTGLDPKTGFKLVGDVITKSTSEYGDFPTVGIMSKPSVSDFKIVGNVDDRYNVGDKITVTYQYNAGISPNPGDASKFASTNAGNPNKDTAPRTNVTRPSIGANRGELDFNVTQLMIDDNNNWHVRVYPIDKSGLAGDYGYITIPIKAASVPTVLSNMKVNGGSLANLPSTGSFNVTYNYVKGTPAISNEKVSYTVKFYRVEPTNAVYTSNALGAFTSINNKTTQIHSLTGEVALGQPITVPVGKTLENTRVEISIVPVDASKTKTGNELFNCQGGAGCNKAEFNVMTTKAPVVSNVKLNIPTNLHAGAVITGTYDFTPGSNNHPTNRDASVFAWLIGTNSLNPDSKLSEYHVQTAGNSGNIKPLTLKANQVGKFIQLNIQANDFFLIRGVNTSYGVTNP